MVREQILTTFFELQLGISLPHPYEGYCILRQKMVRDLQGGNGHFMVNLTPVVKLEWSSHFISSSLRSGLSKVALAHHSEVLERTRSL